MDRWISQVHNLIDLHNIKNKKKKFYFEVHKKSY